MISLGIVHTILVVLLFAEGFSGGSASAQEKKAGQVHQLSNVIVTAQKTEETAQDVPIALSVFDDVNLEDKEIVDLKDLIPFVPSLYLLNPGDEGAYAPSMRGLIAPPETMSSSVGLYIDGVPITNAYGFEAILDDVQRVEVLRGPQGTLYGKNSEAGVINIVTKEPSNTPEGKISLAYGEDNKQEAFTAIRIPIIKDTFFVGITGRYYRKNGNMDNTFLDERLNDRKNYFGKIHLKATPTDRLELALTASKLKRDEGAASLSSMMLPDPRKYPANTRSENNVDDETYTFNVRYDFDSFSFSSTSSYNKWTIDTFSDADFSAKPLSDLGRDGKHNTLSEELKFNGEYNNLKWLFGFFASKNEKEVGFDYSQTGMKTYNEIESRNLGLFTHLDYAVTDKLNIIGGIRYDRDESEVDDRTFIFSQTFIYEDEKNSTDISPKIALEYKWDKRFMTYASIAKGYKSGGFYPYAPQGYPRTYESENLWNYELGLKTALLSNKLVLNADIYYMDITDMQVFTSIDAMRNYISNAASATSYGFEFDANYAIIKNVSIFASFGWNETRFDEFKDVFGDYKDNDNPFAPEYTYSLGGKFRGLSGFYASANLTGYGSMYMDKANTFKNDPYTLVNAKLGYEWDNVDFYLYADNLFDKNYDMMGYYGYYVLINPDREIGLKLVYRF